MMQHFNTLRMKDNCDLSNKRLRCNEYIASFSDREEAIEYIVWKINDKENEDFIRRNLDANSTYGDWDIVFETEEGFDDE